MNKRINKTVSLLSAFALIGMLYNPGVNAAEKNPTTNKLQAQEEALSKALANDKNYHVKINSNNKVEIYTDEVAKINASAKAANGLVYGDWFGGEESYYSMSPSEELKLAAVLTAAFTPFLESEAIAVKAATSISGIIGSTITVSPGSYVQVDRTKQYREVDYSDGTFAYWQTDIGASVTDSDDYLGDGDVIISGGEW